MDKKEQRKFIVELVNNVKKELLKSSYPENWDGIELRWLIKERFAEVVLGDRFLDKRKMRYRHFKNDCLINYY